MQKEEETLEFNDKQTDPYHEDEKQKASKRQCQILRMMKKWRKMVMMLGKKGNFINMRVT